MISNEKLCEEIIDFFAYYLYDPIDEDDVSSLGELYDMEEGRDFRTLRELYGEDKEKITLDNRTVKSLEELVISNYYFMHQINYQYEKPYEVINKHYNSQKEFVSKLIYDIDLIYGTEATDDAELTDNTNLIDEDTELIDNTDLTDNTDLIDDDTGLIDDDADLIDEYLSINLQSSPIIEEIGQKIMDFFNIKEYEKDREYLPDFYLTDYDIYHEHFGVDRNCEAKFLEGEQARKYQEGIKHKRKLHFKKGTTLLETYSYYMKENRCLIG